MSKEQDGAGVERRVVIEMPVPSGLKDYHDDVVAAVIETDIKSAEAWNGEPSVEVSDER